LLHPPAVLLPTCGYEYVPVVEETVSSNLKEAEISVLK